MREAIADVVGMLERQIESMTSACTRCGACEAACPMPPIAGIAAGGASQSDDEAIVAPLMGSIVDWLGGEAEEASSDALRWSAVCTGSGHCIDACPEGLNPRFMLAMARRRDTALRPMSERKEKGKALFRTMSRSVRVMSRLQLPPPLLERLSPSSHPERHTPPDLVFYTGCNLLKTPHIGLLCLDVLDALSISYEVHGGPSSCCGILQMRSGDDQNALRQGQRTIEKFVDSKAADVLSWCPTCQMQFSETTIPALNGGSEPAFGLTMFPVFLARQLHRLRPAMVHPVQKRVAIHEHPGTPGVVEAVRQLLDAVPGLEVVTLDVPHIGYSVNALSTIPTLQKSTLASELAAAEAAGVDALVSVYHTEHREFSAHAASVPFDMVNYMELVGQSMGLHRDDLYQRLRTIGDVDAILATCEATAQANGVDWEQARDVVAAMLNDHILEPGTYDSTLQS